MVSQMICKTWQIRGNITVSTSAIKPQPFIVRHSNLNISDDKSALLLWGRGVQQRVSVVGHCQTACLSADNCSDVQKQKLTQCHLKCVVMAKSTLSAMISLQQNTCLQLYVKLVAYRKHVNTVIITLVLVWIQCETTVCDQQMLCWNWVSIQYWYYSYIMCNSIYGVPVGLLALASS